MDDELDDIRRTRPVGIDVGSWLPEPSDLSLPGVAASLFDAIVAVLITITRTAPQKESARLRGELERLVLWGGSFSLSDGQLDELLSRSSELRHAILSALCELGNVVKDDLLPAFVGAHKNEDVSSLHMIDDLRLLLEKAASILDASDEKADPETLSENGSLRSLRSDVDEIFEDIALYIDCLMDLSPALDSPVLDPELDRPVQETVESFNVSSSQSMVFCRHVRDRFPKMAKFLVERFGEANATRVDRLKAIRDKAADPGGLLTHGLRTQLGGIGKQWHSGSGPKMTASSAYSTHNTESVFDEPYSGSNPKDKMFGDDSSVTTFATGSTSFSTLQKHRPRVPPLPNDAAERRPFKCSICHHVLARVHTRAAWKKHVFEDLQPYVCTIQECTKPKLRFQSSLEWANHETAHRNTRANASCPFCVCDKDLSRPADYFKHTAEHMREISLAVLPPNLEADEDDSDEFDEFFSAPEEISKSQWTVPLERNTGFVGRGSILDNLLDEMETSLEFRRCRVVTLLGLGGIGKTQTALEAVHRIQERVSGCSAFWISARDKKAMERCYREIGQRLLGTDIDEDGVDIQNLVNSALSEKSGKWIMVIDGADHVDLFTPTDGSTGIPPGLTLPNQGSGVVLVTTRSRSVAEHIGSITIELAAMERADNLEWLESQLSKLQLGDVASTDKMLDLLEDHSLTVKQALDYMARTGATTTEYVHRLESDMNTVLEKPEVTIEHLKEQKPEAFEYLKLLTLTGNSPIPGTLLPPGMKARDLQSDRAYNNPEQEAIAALETLGLASQKADGSVHVHGLVRRAIHSSLDSNGELEKHVTDLAQRLVEVYPTPEYENRASWVEYLPHVEALLHFQEACTDKKATSKLLFRAGVSLYILGAHSLAEVYLTQSFDLKLSLDDHDHDHDHDTVYIGNYLHSVRLQLGSSTAAEIENKIQQHAHPLDQPLNFQTSMNLALKLDHEGKHADAEDLLRTALYENETFLNDHPVERFSCMNNLASVLKSQEKYDEASLFHKRALAGFKAVLGPDHPDSLMSMNNLAVLYTCQGQYGFAETTSREVYGRLGKVLGDEHPNTLIAMKNLADILWERDQVPRAEELYMKALPGLEKILGADHSWTRSCSDGLAACRAQPISVKRVDDQVPIIKAPKLAGDRWD